MITRINPSKEEHAVGVLDSATIEEASRSFRGDGALIIEDIIDSALITEARRAFSERYSSYLDDREREDILKVGPRRVLITIALEPPFGDPRLFANPYLLPIIRGALDDFVLGAFGVVCSLPSAPAQHRHNDGAVLFPRQGLDPVLPTTAITVAIPLLEMNEVNGTTALWLGSHRDARRSEDEGIEPPVREGSCMLWDFRLMHGGTPNRGALLRPLLYLTYCRPWFVEHFNFNRKMNPKQKPLLTSKNFFSTLSEQHRDLLARAQET